MLSTKSLILRDFHKDDYEAVHDYASHKENVLYMTFGPNTEEDTRNFLAMATASANESPRKNYVFAIVLKESGLVIGSCDLSIRKEPAHLSNTTGANLPELAEPFLPANVSGVGELGWIIHRDFWHKGYGTEAGEALLDFGFGGLNLHRICATCDAENYGSYKVMENIGMRREGLFIEGRPANLLSPEKRYADEFFYAITYGEWEARKEMKRCNASPVSFGGFIDVPELYDGTVRLICYQKTPADPETGHVPAYHFLICAEGEKAGSIVLRIGYTDALYYGGQIGYEIEEKFRGNGYAARACCLLKSVAKAHWMEKLLITNDVKNEASRRVCEKLGAKLIRVAKIPEWYEEYRNGHRFHNIFEWDVE